MTKKEATMKSFTPSAPRQLGSVPRLSTLCASIAIAAAGAMVPEAASACACGCGVFDFGANTAFPNQSDSGWSAFFRYNYMDQNKNWEGNSSAPASDNPDKNIRTSFFTFGGQYVIDRNWGVMAEIPIYKRSFTSTGDGSAEPAGQIFTSDMTDLGDLMLLGMYTGFSPDMSTGITFGVKLPTGNYTGPYMSPGQTGPGTTGGLVYDRDSLPGTGSTDLLFGGYHAGALNQDGTLSYFIQARYQFAVMERNSDIGSYRPGNELDGAVGISYGLGAVGVFRSVAPVLQLIASDRSSDSGSAANPGNPNNSGYRRVLLAPGIDLRIKKLKIYADVSIPVFQHTTIDSLGLPSNPNNDGNGAGQLIATAIYRLQLGYDF
jgi:hypothetical protein